MSGKDFIPGPDSEFDDFFKLFHDGIVANPTGFGLTAADVALLQTAYSGWTSGYAAHLAAQATAHTVAETKDSLRGGGEKAVRSLTKKVNGNPAADNVMRAKIGLPSHDLVKTLIGAPTTAPIARLEGQGHYTLILHIADQATPHQNAKPHGVHACEIRVHVGDPAPADETGYAFLAHTTRATLTDTHPAADAGKTVYYMVRWLNAKLEPGPWGDVISAKIPV